jgi:hypothetical protein
VGPSFLIPRKCLLPRFVLPGERGHDRPVAHRQAPAYASIDSVRSAPEGIDPFPAVELCSLQVATEPGWEHRLSLEAFSDGERTVQNMIAHPVTAKAFTDVVAGATCQAEERHRIGGWAAPVQGPIEHEIATVASGGGKQRWDVLAAEESGWVLLAQFDSDDAANNDEGRCRAPSTGHAAIRCITC